MSVFTLQIESVAIECAQSGSGDVKSKRPIEERPTAVEQQLPELKRRQPSRNDGKSWIERIAGTFRNDPDFDEIVRLGREFRKSVE